MTDQPSKLSTRVLNIQGDGPSLYFESHRTTRRVAITAITTPADRDAPLRSLRIIRNGIAGAGDQISTEGRTLLQLGAPLVLEPGDALAVLIDASGLPTEPVEAQNTNSLVSALRAYLQPHAVSFITGDAPPKSEPA